MSASNYRRQISYLVSTLGRKGTCSFDDWSDRLAESLSWPVISSAWLTHAGGFPQIPVEERFTWATVFVAGELVPRWNFLTWQGLTLVTSDFWWDWNVRSVAEALFYFCTYVSHSVCLSVQKPKKKLLIRNWCDLIGIYDLDLWPSELKLTQGFHVSWKVLDYSPKISRTWKVLENEFGPGN